MSEIKKVLNEALGVAEQETAPVVETPEPADISRLRQLSGLPKSAKPVSEEIGMANERQLQKALNDVETSIMIMKGKFVTYSRMVNKLFDDMTEDQQMNYRYGVQAMIDILEDELTEIRKLG